MSCDAAVRGTAQDPGRVDQRKSTGVSLGLVSTGISEKGFDNKRFSSRTERGARGACGRAPELRNWGFSWVFSMGFHVFSLIFNDFRGFSRGNQA